MARPELPWYDASGVAVALAFLWFMPWRAVDLGFLPREMLADFGTDMVQSGQHIGGLAWLTLALAVGFGVAGWLRHRLLAAMLAGAGALIGMLLVAQVGDDMRWGLAATTIVFALAAAWQGRTHIRAR